MTSDQDRHAQFMVEALKVVAQDGHPTYAEVAGLASELADAMLEMWCRRWAAERNRAASALPAARVECPRCGWWCDR